jgi:hypothetical protein|tara:strand:- start:356 stop:568 length:213 start_codon:yes stop_codon:yes gene_type:complete
MRQLQTLPILERGILTSVYKQEIKRSCRAKMKSLSEIKSLIINHQGKIASQAGTVLKVSMFLIVFLFKVF